MAETFNILRGKRVVVTRAVEQSESLLQRTTARARRFLLLLPMVSFAPPDDLATVG